MNYWEKFFIEYRAKLLFFLLTIIFALSLLSYHHSDPSFNLATDNYPANFLTYFGSYLADLLYQFFGLAAYLLPLCFASWLYVIFRYEKISWPVMRFISLLKSIIFCSGAFYHWQISTLPANGGGVMSIFIWHLVGLYPDINQLKNLIITCLALFAFLSFIVASAIPFRSFLWLGAKIITLPIFLIQKTGLLRKLLDKISSMDAGPAYYAEEGLTIINKKKNHPTKKIAYNSKTTKTNIQAKTQPYNSAIITPTSNESLGDAILPPLSLLNNEDQQKTRPQTKEELERCAEKLLNVLRDFGVKGEINTIREGPVVTMYEFEPAAGTKSSRVIGLADDIARSLSATSARISVMPGKNALGIELPNQQRAFFKLKELLQTKEFKNANILLPLILGKDLAGMPLVADLAKMPHLLVAGTTGSGKSVAINTMIMSLLYRYRPEECRMIMIDPKMLELSAYDDIPHLMTPVVTEPSKAIIALKWAVKEMENRYRLMSHLGVRNIANYNSKIQEAIKNGEIIERKIQTGFDPETGKPIFEQVPIEMKTMAFIVVIVDEMADLMLVAGKDIETSIQRLAQMARAAGIHIIMATQRPSVDVITGVIKANFPSRISFKVTSKIDSRTILGEQGAEQLLGMGDMLYMGNSANILRVHGPFVEDSEVERVTNFLRQTGKPDYISAVTESDEEAENIDADIGNIAETNDLYQKAVNIVKNERKSSISYIQRSLRIGYNRAANLVEEMEKKGVLSPPNQAGKREILLPE